MKNSKKVVVNTGLLYVKMLITVGISLFSTRLILNALGASDFGIFNVIAGLLGVLGFLNAAMTTSTQRYLSVSMGAKDSVRLKKVFANSVILHLLIGLLLVLVFEVVGYYLLTTTLKIAPERLETAKTIFHFSVISTFLSIISVPYDAVITAHENMVFFVIIDVTDSLLRLFIAFYLTITPITDKLYLFSILVMVLSIFTISVKRIYCLKKYPESRVNILKEYEKKSVHELSSFAGWNLFGALSGILKNQGIAVVLNIFYGTVVNAAYGIANQVSSQLMFLSQSMMRTIRPQMMKSEGAGDRDRMLRLSIIAGKFSFFLFSFFLIPLYIEMPSILAIWLKNVPENTVLFCRLILIQGLIRQVSMGIMSAVQSIGRVKAYQSIAGTIQLLTVPVGYIFLRCGYQAYSILVIAAILEIAATIFRIFYFNYLTKYSVLGFLKEVVLLPLVSFALTFTFALVLQTYLPTSFLSLILVFTGSAICYTITIYNLSLGAKEKQIFNHLYTDLRNRIWSLLKRS